MSQQINLFNPIFLTRKKYFSVLAMGQGLLLIVIGLVLIAVYAKSKTMHLEQEAATTNQQLAAIKHQLNQVRVQYGPRPQSPDLQNQLRKAEAEVQALQQAVEILRNGDIGNTAGYAEYLRAFARQIVHGIWLTDLSIMGAGNQVEVRGRALQPDLVPVYLGRLKQEPVLHGKSFGTLEMQVPKSAQAGIVSGAEHADTDRYIEFKLY